MGRTLGLVFGLILFCASLTVLYLCMRSVMAIGGACAEGGAYQIAVHCPKGIFPMLPLAIFAMIGGGWMYTANSLKTAGSPQWIFFSWSALFGSLGWNFLDFAIHPLPGMDGGDTIAWWICGVVFMIMAAGPLLLWGSGRTGAGKIEKDEMGLWQMLFGMKPKGDEPTALKVNRYTLVLLHFAALAMGVFAGMWIFVTVST